MSVIKVNTIQNANGTTALVIAANGQLSRVNTAIISDGTNSTSATNVIQGSAKAWVNFNGTGTVAIRASYNVSSITDNGTGDYTVNFTTAMPDANYSYTGSCNIATANYNILLSPNRTTAPTSSAFRFVTASSQDGTFYDCAFVYVAVFR
jgi:hypothetical protein